ncbi:MAG: tetratricopeptide repeat protein [Terracidiphilus sp.]
MRGLKASRWVLVLPLVGTLLGVCQAQGTAGASQAPSSASVATSNASPTPEQIGDSLLAHQRYQAAIAAYTKSPRMTAGIWSKMGLAYQMMFNDGDASRCYKESLKLDPESAQVLNNLGAVYASMKLYGQADHMYRKALKLEPRSAIILKNYGTNLLAQHRYNKGWEIYQQALAIDPQIFADHDGPTVQDPSGIHERGAMNYYMAAGCAHAGFVDCALQYLRMALDEGFTTRKKVEADAEFASLRANAAFKQLLAEQHN